MKKMMFLGLVLSVVSLGSAMANDAYAAAEGKPKKVVVNVNMPPVCGGEYHNPGGCPPPPKDGCHCGKGAPKHHKKDPRHHNGPKPRPGKKHKGKGGQPWRETKWRTKRWSWWCTPRQTWWQIA